MNIHEYQAKEILKKFGAKVPNGVAVFSLEEIESKAKLLKSKKIILIYNLFLMEELTVLKKLFPYQKFMMV